MGVSSHVLSATGTRFTSPIYRLRRMSTQKAATMRDAPGYHTKQLIRAGVAIGVIANRRREVRSFTDRQIDLLKIFADQTVIAIENTRLFEAKQASKRDLQGSLEYQTATSDVLAVIPLPIKSTTGLRCHRPDGGSFMSGRLC